MESLPRITESEHLLSNKNLVDGSESSIKAKRKVESLFCVMRKRICRHKSVNDDMFVDLDYAKRGESDFWFENLMDNPYDPLDEGSTVDDCGSDTDLSESSEFDVISEHVLEDYDLITGTKSLSLCNFPCPNEDEATLTSKWSTKTLKSSFLLSPNEVNGVWSIEDEIQNSSLFHSEREKGQMSSMPRLCEDILRCSVNKEDSKIPCNSDIFKNDGDKSSAIEVRYGDVVNMEGSMETMWNKDDEPIPISVVPPDGLSSILLETCSPHQVVGCINDNVHDDSMDIEISPLPLAKTLEIPSRPWSVCGSIAAVRNLRLVEDSSAAGSSLDEQLYVNVSSSEDRNAELAQTPSALYQEEVDGEDEICFSDIDEMIRKLNLVPEDSDSFLYREEWNMSKQPRHSLPGLEHCTRTSMRRAIVFHGAIAVLQCRDLKYFVRKHKVIIGRSSDGLKVDIDLGNYGYGSKISRRQALVKLDNYGSFSLKNLGKQHILVDGEKVDAGQIVTLTSCSSINIRGIAFVFKANKEAVRQYLKNNTGRKSEDDTKFRWCE